MRGKGGGGGYAQQPGLFKRGGVTSAVKKKLPSRPAQLPSMRATGTDFKDEKQPGRWGRPNSLTPPHSASRAPASPSSADEESSLPPQCSVPPTASNRALPGGAVWGSKAWTKEQNQQAEEEAQAQAQAQAQREDSPQQQPSQPPIDTRPPITQWADDEENMDYSKELPSWLRDKEETPAPKPVPPGLPPTAIGAPPTAILVPTAQGLPKDLSPEDLAIQMRKTIERRAKEEEEEKQAKAERLQEKLAAMERGQKATESEANEVSKKRQDREDFEQRQDDMARKRKAQDAVRKEWVKAQVAQRKAAIAEIKRQREKLTAGVDGAAVPKRTTQRVTAPVEVKQEPEPEPEEERHPRANGKGRHYEHDDWDRKGGDKGRKGGYDYRRGGGGRGSGHRSSAPRDKLGGKGFREGGPPTSKFAPKDS